MSPHERAVKELIDHSATFLRGSGAGIEVLVGMIGSGKSTYARKRSGDGAIVVCHDSIVRGVHPGNKYDSIYADMYHRMEAGIALAALRDDFRVVIDRTNLTRESRRRWLTLGKEVGVPVVAVRFPEVSHFEHARRRFEDDPRGHSLHEWEEIAWKHHLQYERSPLARGELFDKVTEPDLAAPRMVDPLLDSVPAVELMT